MKNTHYIEIVGMPGAGKTSAAQKMVKDLPLHDETAQVRTPLATGFFVRLKIGLQIIILLLGHPNLLKLFFAKVHLAYKKTPHIKQVIRNLCFRLVTESIIVRSVIVQCDKNFFINDEGVFGKLIALATLLDLKDAYVRKLLDSLLPKRTILVYIVTPPKEAMLRERLRTIELPFFNDMTQSVREHFFTYNADCYQRFLRDLEKHSDIAVVRLHNDSDAKVFEANIHAAVLELR